MSSSRLPVTVLSGFLGAGKTTLLNHKGRLDLVDEKRGGGALGSDYAAIKASNSGNPFDWSRGPGGSPDGSRFIQAATLRGPVLVNFWGRDCGPCITELPRLGAFAHANPDWTVLLVSTDPPQVAAEFVRRIGLQGIVLRPDANVAALMRSAGNRQGALPFSVGLREGQICRTQIGELHEADLGQWLAACKIP